MNKRRIGLTTQALIIISLLILVANTILGVLMMRQSGKVIKTLIQQRMLDISNSAAGFLDGDQLEVLTKDDEDSEAYQSVLRSLSVFRDNIDLEYIYCIRDMGDKNFVFSVDPSYPDPGEFGEPVVYTDALYQASLGVASVDDVPYDDDWGSFYSAYSPVFNSKGEVAGIVAVDFNADWYDAQIRNIAMLILLSCVLSLILGAMIVIVVTSRVRRRFRALNDEMSDLTAEVDNLTSELKGEEDGSADGTDSAEDGAAAGADTEDAKAELDVKKLGTAGELGSLVDRIHETRENLMGYINHLHTREKNMISALSTNYRSVYYADLRTGTGVCYRSGSKLEDSVPEGESFDFNDVFGNYADKYVVDEYKDEFRRFIDPDNIRERLRTERSITCHYLAVRKGYEAYEMLRIAGIRHPEVGSGEDVNEIGLGFTDVDKETRDSMAKNRALSEALAVAEESSKAKTIFLSNMSHEIRTPMNAIIGLDSIALNDPEISDKTRGYLEKIGLSAKHLLNIINDILDMSRIESGNMTLQKEEFYLLGVLEQVNTIISEQCDNKGISYHCRVNSAIDDYYIGDDVKLRQILINILGNAVKFTPEGGEVSLVIERVARYQGNSTLRFVITDNGIGMDKDFIPHIFDAFSQEDSSITNRHSSTGLGMAITKRIVEMMNGKIEVESEKGKGTTFFVTVTLLDSERSLYSIDSDEITGYNLSALIVDSDPDDCAHAKELLENIGIKADTAATAAKASEIALLRLTRREPYNLVLVDRRIDDADGMQIVRNIRTEVGEFVDVIMTAYNREDIREEAMAAGADGVLSKPLFPRELMDEIRRTMIDKKKASALELPKADLNGKRVLLAEDTQINAEIMMMLLDMRGMKAELAENGRIAVDMFSSHPEGWYDAILMDMRMPEMDGLTATANIRAMDRSDAAVIPIIALTANAFDEDVQRSLQAGLNAHLSKPVDPEKLFGTLETLIRE